MPDLPEPPLESAQALAEVMGMSRYEMTEFEGRAWRAIMTCVPQEHFLAFLQHHVATSGFAPKPSDASRYLDLAINPEVAYAKLERYVAACGPYTSPALDDDPLLVATVLLMGGWVAVNEHMPDPSNTFAVRAFRDRFNACFNQALADVRIQKKLPSRPLRAIGSSPTAALSLPGGEAAAPASMRVHGTER